MVDKKQALDNTIQEVEKVLEKYKNNNKDLLEAYERIEKLKKKRSLKDEL